MNSGKYGSENLRVQTLLTQWYTKLPEFTWMRNYTNRVVSSLRCLKKFFSCCDSFQEVFWVPERNLRKYFIFDFFSLQILISNGDNLIDNAIYLATSFHFFSLTLTVDHLLDRNMWKVFLVLQIQTKDRRNIRYGKKSAIASVVFFDTRMIETQELLLGFYIFFAILPDINGSYASKDWTESSVSLVDLTSNSIFKVGCKTYPYWGVHSHIPGTCKMHLEVLWVPQTPLVWGEPWWRLGVYILNFYSITH